MKSVVIDYHKLISYNKIKILMNSLAQSSGNVARAQNAAHGVIQTPPFLVI